MKEKCILILLVIILLSLILIKLSFIVPSIQEIHYISKLSDDITNNNKNNNNLKVQHNFKTSALSNNSNNCITETTKTNTTTTTTTKTITTRTINNNTNNNRLLKNLIKIYYNSLNNYTSIKITVYCNIIFKSNLNLNLNSNLNPHHRYFQKKKLQTKIPNSYLVVTFMITITLVKFVVVVLAYQQLLQNGYIIIQNLYDKHLKNLNFDLLVCSQQRPYQQLLKSGHGLGVEENHHHHQYQHHQHQQHQPSEKRQFLSLIHNFIEKIIKSRKRKYQQRQTILTSLRKDELTEKKYSPIEKDNSNYTLKLETNSNANAKQLFYHQHSFNKNHDFYQLAQQQQSAADGYHRCHIKYHEYLFIENSFKLLEKNKTKNLNQNQILINHSIYSKAKSILIEKSYFEKTQLLSSHHSIFLRHHKVLATHSASAADSSSSSSSISISAASLASTSNSIKNSNSDSIYNSTTKTISISTTKLNNKKSKPKIIGFVFMQKMLRSCINRLENLPNYYHSTIILPSLTSLSSTICCWKTSTAMTTTSNTTTKTTTTSGNRKRRKRKFSVFWDRTSNNCNKNEEYIRNCNGRAFTFFTTYNCCYCYCCCCTCCCCYYCCCCCCYLKNQLCNVFYENTSEIFLIKCCKMTTTTTTSCNYCSCLCCCHCCSNCSIYYHYHQCHCIYQINNNTNNFNNNKNNNNSNECSFQNNSSCVQLNIFNTNNQYNKTTTTTTTIVSKNIYNLAKETSNHQDRRKWCLQTSSHHATEEDDVNGSNLLRTLNTVKDITSSVVHNRTNNNKRKLKKNLVWLFIGLVWLEGPKLINCSINHNNNIDVTGLNGNETTNKIDSNGAGGTGSGGGGQNQNRNGDNSGGGGGNGNSSGSRNSSSRNNNEGSTNNTNGPGTNSAQTNGKGQKDKSSSSFKIPESESSNSGGGGGVSGHSNNENLNEFLLNKQQQEQLSLSQITIERPAMHSEKEFHYQKFGHREPLQLSSSFLTSSSTTSSSPSSSSSSYIVSRINLSPKRSNMDSSPPLLYVSEEVNRAQSDLSRLESIKRQILTKLGLTEKPNVTHPLPKQFIWDTIYRADGIRSVSDFDFNDNNHRMQEHMRLKTTTDVLETPPLVSRQNAISNSNRNQKNQFSSRNSMGSEMKESRTPRSHNIDRNNEELKTLNEGSRWKLFNLTSQQQEFLREYRQKQQRLRNNKNITNRNKNRFSDPDYLEGDDFFGSTQEIITFAEKGKIYKKHRLVEFSPPSNKIPKQKLQIRNAEIHIRIEKVSPIPGKTSINQLKRRNHHHRMDSSREPGLKIWIFQLIGSDFSRKGFDQVARLCTSLSVDHNVLGWQKLDITETVQFWYGKHQNDKLRLLIDCTGCGNRYILHLFDKKFHHSLFLPRTLITTQTTTSNKFQQQILNDTLEQQNNTIYNSYSPLNNERVHHDHYSDHKNSNKSSESLRYLYHYRQYSHHRYRRKNRTVQMLKFKQHNLDSVEKSKLEQFNKLQMNNQLLGTGAEVGVGQTKVISHPQSLWLKSRTYRKSREIKNNPYLSQDNHGKEDQEQFEGISYEVAAAEFHLEDRLNPNRPFLVLHTEPSRARRVRRRAVDCSGAMHGQCCKESFYVSFKALGWDDWIIAPRGYFANYCRGDCTGPFRTPDTFQTFHAHFIEEYRKMGLLNGMQPCCAPVKFSSMSLIYYGDDGIIKRDLPKMVVDECGCP